MNARSGGRGKRRRRDDEAAVLEPEFFRETWGITLPPRRDKDRIFRTERDEVEELVADLTERVAKRIHECEELQIAHENIRKIDNLWGFERLTSLSLDNNWIDRMQGLDHLTTLTVLDLSFNKIKRIEGISSLVGLTELNLASNSIRTLEGLDTLTALNTLILANNEIGEADDRPEGGEGSGEAGGVDSGAGDGAAGDRRASDADGLAGGGDSAAEMSGLQIDDGGGPGGGASGEGGGGSGTTAVAVGGGASAGGAAKGGIDLSILLYLRQFKDLRLLVLAKNKVAEHPNYKGYVTVFLETVLYLDYRLLSPEDREAGLTTFREDLHALVQEEKEVEADRARSIASEHDHQRLVDAHVDAYAGTALFESLFDDPEYEKVSSLGRISAQMEMYREDFLKETRGFIDIVLEAHGLRGAEVTAFMQEIETAKEEVEAEAIAMVDAFNAHKKRICAELMLLLANNDPDGFRTKLATELVPAIDDLCDDLMELELYQTDQFEDAVLKFSRVIRDLQNANVQTTRFFNTLRNLEDSYYDIVRKQANTIAEAFHRDELEQEEALSDELKTLLMDKEGFLLIFHTSHDTRLDAINALADEYTNELVARNDKLLDDIAADLHERNRLRVHEIFQLRRFYHEEAEEIRTSYHVPVILG